MKDPWTWTEADLQQMQADGVEESLTLDYKAAAALAKSDSKRFDISKDVSAFANSAGGVIVYGMKEEKHLPAGLDPIDPAEFTREWLEEIINSRIHPHLVALRINPVRLAGGQVAYVVCVPYSLSAPHQASDRRYYKRYNFQSLPMEDYEIRDIARRVSGPLLDLQFDQPTGGGVFDGQVKIRIPVSIENRSSSVGTDIHCRVWIDEGLTHDDGDFQGNGETQIRYLGVPRTAFGLSKDRRHIHDTAVWQGLSRSMGTLRLKAPQFAQRTYPIVWEVLAPNMSVRRGAVLLTWGKSGGRLDVIQAPDVDEQGFTIPSGH